MLLSSTGTEQQSYFLVVTSTPGPLAGADTSVEQHCFKEGCVVVLHSPEGYVVVLHSPEGCVVVPLNKNTLHSNLSLLTSSYCAMEGLALLPLRHLYCSDSGQFWLLWLLLLPTIPTLLCLMQPGLHHWHRRHFLLLVMLFAITGSVELIVACCLPTYK